MSEVKSPESGVVLPGIEEVRQAVERLKGYVVRTPLLAWAGPGKYECRTANVECGTGTGEPGSGIMLKPEVLQPTGSFKVRGVLNWALGLAPEERRKGFSTFSAGNTALALAHAARMFGVPCRSILPEYAPENKVRALKEAGVETVLLSFDAMMDWVNHAGWKEEPYCFLHPWFEPAMIAGHGTIGLELVEDMPDLEAVFVPVGGGALACGVGAAVKALAPGVRVVAVQTESYPALAASFKAGKPARVEPKPTICDGVAVPFVTEEMFPLLRQVVDEVVLVSEEEVRQAIRRLALSSKLVAEGAGALALAAGLRAEAQGRAGFPCVCLVTGGSIGAARLAEIIA